MSIANKKVLMGVYYKSFILENDNLQNKICCVVNILYILFF